MSYVFGFIGAGNMGGSLAKGARNTLPAEAVVLSDQDMARAEALAKELSCSFDTGENVAKNSDYIFLGVKPHIMPILLDSLKDSLASRETPAVLVSMAAGLTVAQLEEMSSADYPIIRIMPNTPVSLGAGVILYAHNKAVSPEQLEKFVSIMSGSGKIYPLAESLMDAGSSVSGCGPAFAYLFIDGLADGGVAMGLSRSDALNFAAQTVLGAAMMVLETGKHPDQLKNEVCSPGGSTIQGVRTLEKLGLRSACMEAVIAATEKNKALGNV